MEDINGLNDRLHELDIDEEENITVVLEGEEEEDANKYELCLVRRFLTDKNVNVRAMRSRMADVWRHVMGINIRENEQGIFLFQFYHREDMHWVLKGCPWSFDSAMLVLSEIPTGVEPFKVPLYFLNM